MAKTIKFKSNDDNALSPEQRTIEVTDTVETVSNLSIENLLEAVATYNAEISKITAKHNALIDELEVIKTTLSLSFTVPSSL